jgi:hypothetical protein
MPQLIVSLAETTLSTLANVLLTLVLIKLLGETKGRMADFLRLQQRFLKTLTKYLISTTKDQFYELLAWTLSKG